MCESPEIHLQNAFANEEELDFYLHELCCDCFVCKRLRALELESQDASDVPPEERRYGHSRESKDSEREP